MANSVKRFLIVCCVLLPSLFVGCGDGNNADDVYLTAIDITPAKMSLAAGTSQQFVATGTYSDNSRLDLTDKVVWRSSDTSVATVGNVGTSKGVVTSQVAGTTIITATLGLIARSAQVTVTSATLISLGVTPTSPSIPLGIPQQFTATGIFSDQSVQDLTESVIWSSSAPGIAAISNTSGSRGLASSVTRGSVTITATLGGTSGNTLLTVTDATLSVIEITPSLPNIALGTTQQFQATGIFSDGSKINLSTTATWSTGSPGVATVAPDGLTSTVGVGSSLITASLAGKSGSTSLTVTAAKLTAIEISPLNPRIAVGTDQQCEAIGIYSDNSTQDLTADVVWKVADPALASVSNATGSNGLVTALASGTTTLTATLGSIERSDSLTLAPATLVSLDVTPALPSVPVGVKQQFYATGTFSDSTTKDMTAEVTWTSSATTQATVSNAFGSHGLAKTLSAGDTTISARFGAVTAGTVLTINSATLAGIEITPVDPVIPLGLTRQFVATGIYSDDSIFDLTEFATWSSSAQAVATVGNSDTTAGLATSVAPGSTIISATYGGITATTNLSVTSATLVSIAIAPVNATIAMGTIQSYSAIGTYSDSSSQDLSRFVTWKSSSPAVAPISNAGGDKRGVATAVGVGTTTINAAFDGISSNSATLTVTNATLQSISLNPPNKTIARSTTQQFTAIGTFSDNSTQDLTNLVTWTSSSGTVAKISNATGSKGLATGIGVGTTSIGTQFSGISGTTTLTVVNATLQSISVTPAATSIAVGMQQQFTATGIFTGGIVQDLTKSVKWTSSNKNIASISNGKGSRGLASGMGAGAVTITATKSATVISGSTGLNVTP